VHSNLSLATNHQLKKQNNSLGETMNKLLAISIASTSIAIGAIPAVAGV